MSAATLRVCIRAGTGGTDGEQRRRMKDHFVLGIWCAGEARPFEVCVTNQRAMDAVRNSPLGLGELAQFFHVVSVPALTEHDRSEWAALLRLAQQEAMQRMLLAQTTVAVVGAATAGGLACVFAAAQLGAAVPLQDPLTALAVSASSDAGREEDTAPVVQLASGTGATAPDGATSVTIAPELRAWAEVGLHNKVHVVRGIRCPARVPASAPAPDARYLLVRGGPHQSSPGGG